MTCDTWLSVSFAVSGSQSLHRKGPGWFLDAGLRWFCFFSLCLPWLWWLLGWHDFALSMSLSLSIIVSCCPPLFSFLPQTALLWGAHAVEQRPFKGDWGAYGLTVSGVATGGLCFTSGPTVKFLLSPCSMLWVGEMRRAYAGCMFWAFLLGHLVPAWVFPLEIELCIGLPCCWWGAPNSCIEAIRGMFFAFFLHPFASHCLPWMLGSGNFVLSPSCPNLWFLELGMAWLDSYAFNWFKWPGWELQLPATLAK